MGSLIDKNAEDAETIPLPEPSLKEFKVNHEMLLGYLKNMVIHSLTLAFQSITMDASANTGADMISCKIDVSIGIQDDKKEQLEAYMPRLQEMLTAAAPNPPHVMSPAND